MCGRATTGRNWNGVREEAVLEEEAVVQTLVSSKEMGRRNREGSLLGVS
jgi:hypothetical protein